MKLEQVRVNDNPHWWTKTTTTKNHARSKITNPPRLHGVYFLSFLFSSINVLHLFLDSTWKSQKSQFTTSDTLHPWQISRTEPWGTTRHIKHQFNSFDWLQRFGEQKRKSNAIDCCQHCTPKSGQTTGDTGHMVETLWWEYGKETIACERRRISGPVERSNEAIYSIDCKKVGFFLKSVKKSVKRGVCVLRARSSRASHARRAVEEKHPSWDVYF